MSAKLHQLDALLRPVVEGLGYECWGIEFVTQGGKSVLRVFIDKETGISVEDCEAVSRQASGILDVEDPISSDYYLEVSSPGMDRPLFELGQYARYAGHKVQVRLRMPFEGRRKYVGILKGVENDEVVLIVDDHELLFPIDSIDKANVVPVFE